MDVVVRAERRRWGLGDARREASLWTWSCEPSGGRGGSAKRAARRVREPVRAGGSARGMTTVGVVGLGLLGSAVAAPPRARRPRRVRPGARAAEGAAPAARGRGPPPTPP